jgi:hypothetical protein
MDRPFKGINAHYFLDVNRLKCNLDVYIRVKKKEVGEYHYMKVLHAGDSFSEEEVKKYINAGLEEFFIHEEYFSTFIQDAAKQLISWIAEGEPQKTSTCEFESRVYDIVLEHVKLLAIDEITVKLVESGVASMKNSVGGQQSLLRFMDQLQANKFSFRYARTHLTCLLLYKVINKFEWNSWQIQDRLMYVAYFHDLTLTDDLYVKIHSAKEFDKTDLSGDEKKLVLNHALNASLLIDKFSCVPDGVSTIIKEHHGTKTGINFYQGLNMTISPLSMVFIVIERFVDEVLKAEDPTKARLVNILGGLQKVFDQGTYLQTMNILNKMYYEEYLE